MFYSSDKPVFKFIHYHRHKAKKAQRHLQVKQTKAVACDWPLWVITHFNILIVKHTDISN